MSEFLTSRQVQSLLNVDRITVYRMLNDGRLRGVKIGQQWRFHKDDVERLLSGQPPLPADSGPAGDATFPTHCIQTVQNLFSGVSQMSAVMVDMQGELLTQPSNPCALCRLMLANRQSEERCRESWHAIAGVNPQPGQVLTCHAGLHYIAAPVQDQGAQIGWVLVGQARLRTEDKPIPVAELATLTALPQAEVQAAAEAVPEMEPDHRPQVAQWVALASQAIESILQERASFIHRLQQIAHLTRIG